MSNKNSYQIIHKAINELLEGRYTKLNFNNYKVVPLTIIIALSWTVFAKSLSFFWDYGVLQGFAPTALVIAILYCYDRWLWKLPVFSWLVNVPNLNGKYRGSVEYHWDGKNQKKECTLEIRQTASHIKVDGEFSKKNENDTTSESKLAFFTMDNTGAHKLYIYYQNEGSGVAGDTLNQHEGFEVLRVKEEDNRNITLTGYYFTNRDPQTKGRINLKRQAGDST